MTQEPVPQNPSSVSPNGPTNKTPVETLILAENLSQAEIKQLLGTAFFNEHASLLLFVESENKPLVIKPTPRTFLGRSEDTTPECLHVDLTSYGAKEKGVSRLHVVLYRTQVTISLEDLNSTNRTYINGEMIPARQVQMLHDADEILLGAMRIRLSFQYG